MDNFMIDGKEYRTTPLTFKSADGSVVFCVIACVPLDGGPFEILVDDNNGQFSRAKWQQVQVASAA